MNVSNLTINHLHGAQLEIKVRLSRHFLWRMTFGIWLIKLGARLMPLDVKVETY